MIDAIDGLDGLLVIDMQTAYCASAAIAPDVAALVEAFLGAGKPVVFVCLGDSPIVPELTPFVGRAHMVKKYTDDGSMYIVEWRGITARPPARPFGVCGVNTPYCVRETVEGLYKRGWPLAVFDSYCACEEWGLPDMRFNQLSASAIHDNTIQLFEKRLGDRVTIVYGRLDEEYGAKVSGSQYAKTSGVSVL